jgi:hypothetical protein
MQRMSAVCRDQIVVLAIPARIIMLTNRLNELHRVFAQRVRMLDADAATPEQ